MIEGIGRYTSRIFSNTTRSGKPAAHRHNYKARLWSTPVSHEEETPQWRCPYADRVRYIATHMQIGVAYQSLAAAALETLHRVIAKEKLASRASISLAQGEKLEEMIRDSVSTADALTSSLGPQRSHLLRLDTGESQEGSDQSWWYALTETIETIEDGINRILSLSASQPHGGAARQLGAVIIRLLRSHHRQLMTEADAWIS